MSFEFEPDNSHVVSDWIATLNKINYHIAKLKKHKSALEHQLLKHFNRITVDESDNLIDIPHEGRISHHHDKYKVIIKTLYNYSIDKEEYELCKNSLNASLNPVKESVKYDFSKRAYEEAKKFASKEELAIIDKFLTFKPAAPSVSIEANI